MEVKGYTLDLYCDNPDHDNIAPWKSTSCDGSFFGETYQETKRMAVKSGWKYTRDDRQICPYCSKKT